MDAMNPGRGRRADPAVPRASRGTARTAFSPGTVHLPQKVFREAQKTPGEAPALPGRRTLPTLAPELPRSALRGFARQAPSLPEEENGRK